MRRSLYFKLFLLLFTQYLLYYTQFKKSILFVTLSMDQKGSDARVKAAHLPKYQKLGLKISYYRKLRGLSQEQLAERIDKSLSFLGAVEAPKVNRSISLDTLFDIAEALNVAPDKFLHFDED